MNQIRVMLASALGLSLAGLAPAQDAEAQPEAGAWYEQIEFGGDLRLRHEKIRQAPGSDRDRERYRARLSVGSALTENVSVDVRLATGTGDPVSANLDFGESFTADDIQLDRAYLTWSLNDRADIFGGKMKNPLYRPGETSLMWDSDLNPEGVAASAGRGAWFGTLGAFSLADQEAGGHSRLYALQGGRTFDFAEGAKLTAGIGYYDYANTEGRKPFFDNDPAGNTVDANGNFVYDYNVVELFAAWETQIGDLPLEFFGEWANNTEAPRADTAFAVGASVGSTEAPGGFSVGWAYHDTEADALIGLYTDSDLAGGNTDSNGHVFEAEYALTEHVALGATFILSEFGGFTGEERDFNRMMLDVQFSF